MTIGAPWVAKPRQGCSPAGLRGPSREEQSPEEHGLTIIVPRPRTRKQIATHKPKNDYWLKRHPNVQFHFTPTRASWRNQVEIWFSILEGKSLHGASFASVKQVREHIDAFTESYNQDAKPGVADLVWAVAALVADLKTDPIFVAATQPIKVAMS